MDRFEKNVLETIRREKLIPEGAAVTVGFSGGADSVCLLSVLAALKGLFHLSLNAVHVNHGIRGAEADRMRSSAAYSAENGRSPLPPFAWTYRLM